MKKQLPLVALALVAMVSVLPHSAYGNGSVSTSPQGIYPVYEMQSPAVTYSRTVYIDPQNGSDNGDGSQAHPYKTLATAISKKDIEPGDHVVLLPGDQGSVSVTTYNSPGLVGSTKWIWLDFQPGAYAEIIHLSKMSDWLITGATITTTTNKLFEADNSTNIVLADSNLYTTLNTSAWTVNDWINTAANNGVDYRDDQCASLLRSKITNVRFGVEIASDNLTGDPTQGDNLVEGNEVANFSADGMDVTASYTTVQDNYVHDSYVSEAEGDANHDDGLQMWAANSVPLTNVLVTHNWIQETTNPNRALNAPLQGIDDFDAPSSDIQVTNNVVLVSAYHGISLYGSSNSLIDHNIVANPSADGYPTWIMFNASKTGGAPVNDVISNNIATHFSATPTGVTLSNNYTETNPAAVYTTFATTTMSFNLAPKTGSAIYGKGAGSTLLINIFAGLQPGMVTAPTSPTSPTGTPISVGQGTSSTTSTAASTGTTTPSVTITTNMPQNTNGSYYVPYGTKLIVGWNAANVTSCKGETETATDTFNGVLPTSGTFTDTITNGRHYFVICSAKKGGASSFIWVNVSATQKNTATVLDAILALPSAFVQEIENIWAWFVHLF